MAFYKYILLCVSLNVAGSTRVGIYEASPSAMSNSSFVEHKVLETGLPPNAEIGQVIDGSTCRVWTCSNGFCSGGKCHTLKAGSPGCTRKDGTDANCDPGTWCIEDTCRSQKLGQGQACSAEHSNWCDSGLCIRDRCVISQGLCEKDYECKSNICIKEWCSEEKLKAGENCISWSASTGKSKEHPQWCKSGICQFTCKGAEGDFCNYDYDCMSNVCFKETCRGERFSIGEGCGNHDHCQSNLCINNLCVDQALPAGSSCSQDKWCLSNMCIRGACIGDSNKPLIIGSNCEKDEHCISQTCEMRAWNSKGRTDKICKNTGYGSGQSGCLNYPGKDSWCTGVECEFCSRKTRCVTKTYGAYGHTECANY